MPKATERAAKEAGVLDAFRPKHFNILTRQNLEALTSLKTRFPNAEAAIGLVYDQLYRHWQFGNDRLQMRPIILAGEPGVGKTRLCREIAKVLNIDVTIRSVAGHADANIFGVSAGWSTAMPSVITKAVCSSGALNPLIMIDELDKALPSHNGSVWAELLGLLENAEARTFYERFLATNVNASHISWLFTANDLSKLPRPLLSRCLVVHVDGPSREQVPSIIRSLKADYAQELGVDERLFAMTVDDHDWLLSTWPDHRSIRVLSELLRSLIDRSQTLIASV
ncbi:MAG: AAA family ATPase [Tateyamaria sp.]|uniref:AAA family ATPase n=1 Tax=Tateyamaria sp. TaxID=1929288 RepID=UPI0032DD35EC